MSTSDIQRFEINEACAAQIVHNVRTLELVEDRLGRSPALRQVGDAPGVDGFVAHLSALGVAVTSAVPVTPATEAELTQARSVVLEAADRGYRVARAALFGGAHE